MRTISSLMRFSLFPKTPPLAYGCLFFSNPLRGELSLKGQRKLLAILKLGPQVQISWIRSSIQAIPCLPSSVSMMLLSVRGILPLLTLPYPLLQMSLVTVDLVGYPQVTNGSTILIMLMVALLRRMKTPLWSYLKRRSCIIFLGLGASLLILFSYIRLVNRYLPSGTDDKSNFGFGLNKEVSCGFGSSFVGNHF